MNNKSGKKIIKNPTPELGLVPNLSKRSFTKAAFLAPVILSLANRPAWGATNRCMVSGFSSIMEIGSGVAGDSATCSYASAADILSGLPVETPDIRDMTISNLFGYVPVVNPTVTVREALNGGFTPDGVEVAPWTHYIVLAYFNSLPLFDNNNPFPCPAAEVFVFFETNIGGAFNFGHVSLDQAQTLEFLKAVML